MEQVCQGEVPFGQESVHREYRVGKFVEVHCVLRSQPRSLFMNVSQ